MTLNTIDVVAEIFLPLFGHILWRYKINTDYYDDFGSKILIEKLTLFLA